MVNEMTAEADDHNAEVWHGALAELDGDRAEIDADVLEHHGFVVAEHEWPAFLAWVEQFRAS